MIKKFLFCYKCRSSFFVLTETLNSDMKFCPKCGRDSLNYADEKRKLKLEEALEGGDKE